MDLNSQTMCIYFLDIREFPEIFLFIGSFFCDKSQTLGVTTLNNSYLNQTSDMAYKLILKRWV